eukprot:gnl/TRDRNA2_/TRDRNA2_174938_c14_seq2.p3 gnl/TRDRNA2_/TRDRNA2_174938_c14~~gnl/TRDRNA2_/TRDRNA2_174938_c14_seq2.p3  ORF type:complete len:147 (+),score=25.11 gnl/TRDRNA2_/TRDRNA2_174938_c14_seq2:706-1146(+)
MAEGLRAWQAREPGCELARSLCNELPGFWRFTRRPCIEDFCAFDTVCDYLQRPLREGAMAAHVEALREMAREKGKDAHVLLGYVHLIAGGACDAPPPPPELDWPPGCSSADDVRLRELCARGRGTRLLGLLEGPVQFDWLGDTVPD